MAYDAFEYSLEEAFNDATVRHYIADSRLDADDIFDSVLELAKAWDIKVVLPTGRSESSTSATPSK